MNEEKRKQFGELLYSIGALCHENFGTEREFLSIHIMLEIMRLAEDMGAEKWEIFTINHNAQCRISGKEQVDVDKHIETCKLIDILHDVKI